MKKYLYVKDIDKDILQALFDYKKYGSNPRISELEDFRLPKRLDWFFRTGELIKTRDTGKCSFYIDISNVNLTDTDREFLCNISHVAIDDRFSNTNYYGIDLLQFIPINGFKRAIYCCIKFAKKYPNFNIRLVSKYNKSMCLSFMYLSIIDKMNFEIIVNLLNKFKDLTIVKRINNATYINPLIFIYKHGEGTIDKFEKRVFSYSNMRINQVGHSIIFSIMRDNTEVGYAKVSENPSGFFGRRF